MHKMRIVYLSCIAIAHQKIPFSLVRSSLIFPSPEFTASLLPPRQVPPQARFNSCDAKAFLELVVAIGS